MVFTVPKEAPAPRVIRDADMVEMVKLSGTADKVLTALAIGREKSAFAFEPDKGPIKNVMSITFKPYENEAHDSLTMGIRPIEGLKDRYAVNIHRKSGDQEINMSAVMVDGAQGMKAEHLRITMPIESDAGESITFDAKGQLPDKISGLKVPEDEGLGVYLTRVLGLRIDGTNEFNKAVDMETTMGALVERQDVGKTAERRIAPVFMWQK